MESKSSNLYKNILALYKHISAKNESRVICSVVHVTETIDLMRDALPGVNIARFVTS